MTVDNRQKNERSRSGNPYFSHVKAGKHAGTVYNFKRKSRIRKSLMRLPILLNDSTNAYIDVSDLPQHQVAHLQAIVENKFSGLLYDNEIFQPLEAGMRLKAYEIGRASCRERV